MSKSKNHYHEKNLTNCSNNSLDSVSTEGTKYFDDKALKSDTNNQWCSNASTEGINYFNNKAEKSATNNQWVSTGATKR